jgi:hypothetical protein
MMGIVNDPSAVLDPLRFELNASPCRVGRFLFPYVSPDMGATSRWLADRTSHRLSEQAVFTHLTGRTRRGVSSSSCSWPDPRDLQKLRALSRRIRLSTVLDDPRFVLFWPGERNQASQRIGGF